MNLASGARLMMSRDILAITTVGESAAASLGYRVGRDAVKCPAVHRQALPKKNYLAQNITRTGTQLRMPVHSWVLLLFSSSGDEA